MANLAQLIARQVSSPYPRWYGGAGGIQPLAQRQANGTTPVAAPRASAPPPPAGGVGQYPALGTSSIPQIPSFNTSLQAGDATPGWAAQYAQGLAAPDVSLRQGQFDLSTDPELIQARNDALQQLTQQRAQTWGQRERDLIGLGNRDLASTILGAQYPGLSHITDQPYGGFSTLSQIAKQYLDTLGQTESDLNKQNLFYSGTRFKARGNLDYARQQAIAQATSTVQDALAQLAGQDTSSANVYVQQLHNALAAAYQRALARAAQSPPGAPPFNPPPVDRSLLAQPWTTSGYWQPGGYLDTGVFTPYGGRTTIPMAV